MPNSPVTDSQQQARALNRREDLLTPFGAAPSAIAERIDAERVRILYSVAPFNILIHVLASSVLAYAISGTVDGSLLAGWYAVMLLVCACCWALQHGYHDADKLPGQARVWEVRFAAAAVTPWQPGDVPTAPLTLYRTPVEPEWVDYNGHMTESAYLTAAGWASDALFRYIGDDEAYRAAGNSFYTVETHIHYVREVAEHEPIEFTTHILGVDAKHKHVLLRG